MNRFNNLYKDKYVLISLVILGAIILCGVKNEYIPLAALGLIIMIFLSRYWIVSIFLIIAINENMFYLIPKNVIPTEFVVVIFTIVLLSCFFLRNESKVMYFRRIIICFIIIPIISSFNAYLINNQPVLMGISAAKRYFIYGVYLYLVKNLKSNNDVEVLKKVIMYSGFILSMLFIFQSIGKLNIFDVKLMPMRNSFIRFFDGYILIMFSYLICLVDAMNEKISLKKSALYLLLAFCEFISIVLVAQTRNFIISTIVITFIIIIFQKKYKKILIVSILIVSMLSVILFNVEINIGLENMFNSLLFDIKNRAGTIGFRISEIEFYLKTLLKNIIFGLGYYNDGFYNYNYITGLNNNYYLNDVGLVGYLFQVGSVGLIIFISLILRLYKITILLYKKNNQGYLITVAFLSFILTGIIGTFYIDDLTSVLYTSIILSIIEYYYKEVCEECEKYKNEKINNNNCLL
ncbi:MAG: hypothetical protein E6Z86_14195 [Clostridium butyricum]|nr:hypothetical protein [Clostridium butyricum]MDU5821067.1 hypothetical protein [Clostridium butyricum]